MLQLVALFFFNYMYNFTGSRVYLFFPHFFRWWLIVDQLVINDQVDFLPKKINRPGVNKVRPGWILT